MANPTSHGWARDHDWERQIANVFGDQQWQGLAPRAWRKGLLRALVSRDELEPGDQRWHISLQHRDRVPNWAELVAAAHELRPGVVFCIPMPPRAWWLNVHANVLHLHEIRDEPLVAQWRAEALGMEPT